jgi:hypothetical protein
MPKSLTEIAQTLSITKSQVQNPIPKIFLCGGTRPNQDEPPNSLRGVLLGMLEGETRVLPRVMCWPSRLLPGTTHRGRSTLLIL